MSKERNKSETAYKKWVANILKPFTDKHPERQDKFATVSGNPVDVLYIPGEESEAIGAEFPGEFPFTRGIYPNMYRGRLWTMRQYAGFGTARQSNERYRFLLSRGQTGLSVAFDLPTQIGYDSDHPLADGEVGKVGVAIDSLQDMEILFRDIPLDKVSTSMTINAPAAILLCMYIAVAEKQGVKIEDLRGTIQNDILKEYIARGTYIFPPAPSMRLITDIFAYCRDHLPRWNTISISGYHIREAGSTAGQEIGFTLANGLVYVETAMKAGLDIDSFAPRLSFFFNSHNDLIEEIAKFRAARRLWAKLIKERYNPGDPRSMMLRFHTQTAGCTLTAQQPENNIVRVTIQALAAVLGGTQSLHTNSMDEAFSLPVEKSVRTALRTQQIIAYESGIVNSVDPLAGSFFLEHLTAKLEQEALDYINKIESMGGVINAIESGYIQKEIQRSAYQYQKSVESQERIIVGVNEFREDETVAFDTLKVDYAVQEEQLKRLKELKKRRNNDKVTSSLNQLKKEAESRNNLIPCILECVRNYATIGEICGVLREVFGEYKEVIIV